jgi:predicted RNase H-like nuclease (RuvC/YqgF family)
MSTLLEENIVIVPEVTSNHVRMRMLQQMSEALEDEASSLLLRAAALEEEDLLINRQIDERQTEINRLQLKLEAIQGERDSLIERVECLRDEARAMTEEAYNNEDEIALSVIDDLLSVEVEQGQPRGPIFFQRSRLSKSSGAR